MQHLSSSAPTSLGQGREAHGRGRNIFLCHIQPRVAARSSTVLPAQLPTAVCRLAQGSPSGRRVRLPGRGHDEESPAIVWAGGPVRTGYAKPTESGTGVAGRTGRASLLGLRAHNP
eukprot:COSAG01_NODE_798_length_13503_cov_8.878395_18_plen_116_part_00